MTTLPIPFVVALLLLLLAASNHHQMKETPSGRVFAMVLYTYALSMVCIGLRWSMNMVALLPVAATLSVIGAVLLYLGFRSLGRMGAVINLSRDWVHLVPITLVAMSALMQTTWVEVFLIATKLLYAGLLVQMARQMPDSLQLVRLSWLKNSQQALWGAALLLLVSVAVDIAISIDFALYEGRHSANLVGFVNFLILLLLGWASVSAGRGRVVDRDSDSKTDCGLNTDDDADQARSKDRIAVHSEHMNTSETDDLRLLEQLNSLLVDDRLYADTELNLQRLARKAGVPARSISRVINTHTGRNISRWINSVRIDAACTLLKDADVSVSQAMLEAGFLTKSNFNREFRRIKGCSPSEWRAKGAD